MTIRVAAVVLGLMIASQADAGPCDNYSVVVSGDELVATDELKRWATYALRGEGLLNERSSCAVVIVTMSLQNRAGTRVLGWTVHAYFGVRKFGASDTEGVVFLDTERGRLFTDARREDLQTSVRTAVEDYISKLK